MLVADFWFEAEDLFFDVELADFEPPAFVLPESVDVAACTPAPTAPVTAPPTAPVAAPLIISLNASVAALIKPLPELEFFFPPLLFWLELLLFLAGAAFFAGADLAVDFEPELVLLDVDDFDPEPDDLLAVDLEAEPDDLPAEVFEPVDLLAEVFDADEPDDFAAPDLAAGFAAVLLVVALEVFFDELLAEVDFAAVFEPEDLFVEAALVGAAFLVDDEAALVIAVFLFFVVVDFAELLVGFLVAIFFSLKCLRTNFTKTGLKQTHERIFTRIDCACQDIFSVIEFFVQNKFSFKKFLT